MTFETLAASKLFVKAEALGEKPNAVLVDVRTPQEQELLSIGYFTTLKLPVEKLFRDEGLKQLPQDKDLIIVCHSGVRAVPVAFNLKALGFKNVYVLENGVIGLAQASTPKTFPLKK